ncbi:leucine zipper putative tumor suppressor 2 [Biomphalaria pfeifferi]|uniref:Leucine zipper putative tumor suppressor 2 n=1 Tax=Biomphalaria pfeifferi TaxID=112525 RepID=A0AAD8AXK6_BIOPF|nr:leucine zipper putative tumor suppressor 2 [Biomphalaria pfeifferi]
MSAGIAAGHLSEMSEAEFRNSVYSPASSYSTYSHEVKYIFNTAEDSGDEYTDYSHITTRGAKHNSHTPRTLSATSHSSSAKENLTPHREELEQPYHIVGASTRTGTAVSSRGPISPRAEEVVYSTSHYANGPRRPGPPQDHSACERGDYYSPVGELPPYPYAKHSYPAWKNNNMNNSHNVYSPNQPTKSKNSNVHSELNKQHRNSVGGQLNTFHNHHPLNNINNHPPYQQPHPQASEPPYPCPPRYNHQQHVRRKTWSPPALKMSLLNAASQGSRVCYSNDSLDFSEDNSIERKTKSMSDDLDVTPPRLAPISGVLAQKPGPNLIRPIAFKPVQMSPNHSPVSHLNRRTSAPDEGMGGAHEVNRPHGLKLGVSMLGVRGSPDSAHKSNPGAFNSMTKSQHLNPIGQHLNNSAADHPQHTHSHPSSINSSHNSSQHSSGSCHNISSNSYSNLPGNSQNNLSANSSHFSGTEDNSFTNEFTKPLDWPSDAIPSANRLSSHGAEGVLQTPSPSDSGVGELEAILREKDAEINTLREVMDRNERAIFQVYEERRHNWLQDTQELREEYERKLKIQSRKSYKTEQVLSLQVYKLQQEQKVLQEEKAKVTNERDMLRQQVEDQLSEISQLKIRLDSVNGCETLLSNPSDSQNLMEELALKNKELITVKSQLHSFELDMDKRNKEIADKVREISNKTDQLKTLKDEISRLKNPPVLLDTASQTHAPSEVATSENMKPSMLGERDKTINNLQDELLDIRAQLTALKEEHEKEREQWLDEKNKVVRYQKQLQLNYVQMQRKNATLENEVQQLTLELESRDMKLITLEEESMC